MSVRHGGGRAQLDTPSRSEVFDSVVICAGAGTAALAGQVDIEVPDDPVHHTRFTFPLRDPGQAPPAWIDQSGQWRAGFGSYGHLTEPGRWAIGGHLAELDHARGVDRASTLARSQEVVSAYVEEFVTGAVPEVVDSISCTFPRDLGDGVSTAQAGPVLAVWGDNLFKFAPVLADVLATAAINHAIPADLRAAAHHS